MFRDEVHVPNSSITRCLSSATKHMLSPRRPAALLDHTFGSTCPRIPSILLLRLSLTQRFGMIHYKSAFQADPTRPFFLRLMFLQSEAINDLFWQVRAGYQSSDSTKLLLIRLVHVYRHCCNVLLNKFSLSHFSFVAFIPGMRPMDDCYICTPFSRTCFRVSDD